MSTSPNPLIVKEGAFLKNGHDKICRVFCSRSDAAIHNAATKKLFLILKLIAINPLASEAKPVQNTFEQWDLCMALTDREFILHKHFLPTFWCIQKVGPEGKRSF